MTRRRRLNDETRRRRGGARWLPAVGAAVGLLALGVLSTDVTVRVPHSYASTSAVAHALVLTAGVALVLVGAVGWLLRPHELAGRAVLGIGIAWLAADLIGWTAAAWASTLAMAVAPWSVPLLVHLAFAFPNTVIRGRVARILVVGTYASTAVISIALVTVYDPFFDLDCWRTCARAPFVVSNRPRVSDAIETWWLGVVVVAGLSSAAHAGRAVVRRRWPPRWTSAVFVPLVAVCALEATLAASLLTNVEDPEQPWFARLFVARALSMTALAVGTAVWLARLAVQRRALSHLADEMAEATPGRLRPVLARTLGDDSVEVAFWSPTLGRYVDDEGRTAARSNDPHRITVTVERGGQHLGFVTQDRALARPDVAEQIGAAARLAFDNERLHAERLAQIAELRASRSQIVRTADEARRRIERDLHDGAQQRLLALSFELRLAVASGASGGEDAAHRALQLAATEVRACIDELRELAHGIFPAVLTTAGLSAALDAVRDDAVVPVSLDVAEERLDPLVEMAAYVAVAESVNAAAAAGVDWVRVQGCSTGESYHLVTEWSDGQQPAAALAHVADRVGALGGGLRLSGATLEVELPCALS